MEEWCGGPTVRTALRIMNAGASFFFCSWVCGHFNRVSHQQAVEGWLAEISRQVERVLKALQGGPQRPARGFTGYGTRCHRSNCNREYRNYGGSHKYRAGHGLVFRVDPASKIAAKSSHLRFRYS